MKYFIGFLILFSVLVTSAQQPVNIGFRFSKAVIMPHRIDMRYIIKKPPNEYLLTIGFQTTGKKQWQQHWAYPEIGFGAYYADLNNPDVLGNSKAGFLFINAPVFRDKFFCLNYHFGVGVAYLSKAFNYQTNYYNFAIGSHYNIYANLDIELQYRTKKFIYFGSLGLTHYSNGGTKAPNMGLNLPAISLGLRYKTKDFYKQKNISGRSFKNYSDLEIIQSFSAHANKLSISHPVEFIGSFSADYGYYVSPKSRFGGGLDLILDRNKENYFINDSIFDSNNADYLSYGLHLSYSAVFGNIQFSFQPIFVLHSKYNDSFLYQRYGFRFIVLKKWVLGLSLFTKYFNAIAIEPAIGYRFSIHNNR